MEAVVIPYPPEQSFSHSNQIKSPVKRWNSLAFSSKLPNDQNLAPLASFHGGILPVPPRSLSFSNYQYQHILQPPLLPLPIVPRPYHSLKPNKARIDQSLTPKKSKNNKRNNIQERKSREPKLVASTNRVGPDPNELPKNVTKLFSSSSGNGVGKVDAKDYDWDKFSSSVFSLSPPPSSLPMPKFLMRRKLNCNTEAAGVDDGATDNLRRILNLR